MIVYMFAFACVFLKCVYKCLQVCDLREDKEAHERLKSFVSETVCP